MKVFLVFCIFISYSCSAQISQQFYWFKDSSLTVRDSKIDNQGNVIIVGYKTTDEYGFPKVPIIIKTSRSGEVLWSKNLNNGISASQAMKVNIANNGDYIILEKFNAGGMIRLSPNGVEKWHRHSFFNSTNNTVNDPISGFAELPNGNIVTCGYNDFIGSGQYNGYVAVYDSNGYWITAKKIGQTFPSNHTYYFDDIISFGNRIVVLGSYSQFSINYPGFPMFMVLDQFLNLVSVKYSNTPLLPASAGYHKLTRLSVVDGKLFSVGKYSDFNPPYSFDHIIVVKYDTSSYKLIGQHVSIPGYSIITNHTAYIKDSSTFYISSRPKKLPNQVTKKNFLAGFSNGSTIFSKALSNDSLVDVSCITWSADTLSLVGRIKYGNRYLPYSASLPASMPLTSTCNLEDTVFLVDTFSNQLISPPYPPIIDPLSLGMSYFSSGAFDCTKSMLICNGQIPCPTDLHAALNVSSSHFDLCSGSSFLLLSQGTCYRQRWLKNGIVLNNSSDSLMVADSGIFQLIVDNNYCFDTATVTVSLHPLPNPVISVINSATLTTGSYFSYQWFLNGSPLAGETNQNLNPLFSGIYYVGVSDSFGCSGVSDTISFIPENVEEHLVSMNVEIYPNPTNDNFTINTGSMVWTEISISDLTGKLLSQWAQTGNKKSYSKKSMRLPAGLYILTFRNQSGFLKKKFVCY
jgi:hypothetical protein